jgi:predicted ABC-type sugar transport system permease subunit
MVGILDDVATIGIVDDFTGTISLNHYKTWIDWLVIYITNKHLIICFWINMRKTMGIWVYLEQSAIKTMTCLRVRVPIGR